MVIVRVSEAQSTKATSTPAILLVVSNVPYIVAIVFF
jgi:hypothetical protein